MASRSRSLSPKRTCHPNVPVILSAAKDLRPQNVPVILSAAKDLEQKNNQNKKQHYEQQHNQNLSGRCPARNAVVLQRKDRQLRLQRRAGKGLQPGDTLGCRLPRIPQSQLEHNRCKLWRRDSPGTDKNAWRHTERLLYNISVEYVHHQNSGCRQRASEHK